MGFMDSMFGSSDSESESRLDFYGPTKEPLNNIISEVWPAVQEAQRAIDEGMPDDLVADMTERQRLTIDEMYNSNFLSQGQGQAQDMYGAGSQMAGEGASTLGDFASGANQVGIADDIFDKIYNEDLVQERVDAVGNDIARNLSEGEMLGIDRQFGGGQAGSARAGVAEGVAIRGAQDRFADTATQIRSDAYNQAVSQSVAIDQARKQAQMGAGQQLLNTGVGQQQYGTNTGATMGQQLQDNRMTAGNLQQAQDQAEIQGGVDLMNLRATSQFAPLQAAQNLLLPIATQGGTTFTEGTGPSSGMLGGIVSTASNIFSPKGGGG